MSDRNISADARPRINIHRQPCGWAWSIGVANKAGKAETPGAAVDAAIEHIGLRPVVIILEG